LAYLRRRQPGGRGGNVIFVSQCDIADARIVGIEAETNALPTTATMALESDPRVIDAFKALVGGGYVTSRELVNATGGWPSDLDLVLRDVKPARKGCE
jgi:hypothetical protein